MKVGDTVKIKVLTVNRIKSDGIIDGYGHFVDDTGEIVGVLDSGRFEVVVKGRTSTSALTPAVSYAEEQLELYNNDWDT